MKLASNPIVLGIGGFTSGVLLTLIFLYIPSQKLLFQREQAINDWANFNRQEQERLRELRGASESQLLKWLGMLEKTNTEFQKIQQTLYEQERRLSDPGRFYITTTMILCTISICFYAWVNRNANARDTVTLENFETFFAARIEAISHPRARLKDTDRQDATDVLTEKREGDQFGSSE